MHSRSSNALFLSLIASANTVFDYMLDVEKKDLSKRGLHFFSPSYRHEPKLRHCQHLKRKLPPAIQIYNPRTTFLDSSKSNNIEMIVLCLL